MLHKTQKETLSPLLQSSRGPGSAELLTVLDKEIPHACSHLPYISVGSLFSEVSFSWRAELMPPSRPGALLCSATPYRSWTRIQALLDPNELQRSHCWKDKEKQCRKTKQNKNSPKTELYFKWLLAELISCF